MAVSHEEFDLSGSPWPHRIAWPLACCIFPLIWMGGLVTTYEAGMAVPDWPNTYGYNLFLYPVESWLAVWNIFLEHTHRLIAALVGLLTVALAGLLWVDDRRSWMRWLGLAAVLGVLLQGTLGGLRVLGDVRLLAKIHGSVAPAFFALGTSLVTLTSPQWRSGVTSTAHQDDRKLRRLGLICVAGLYGQIVLGAQLRHLEPGSGLWWFTTWLWLHLIVAGLNLATILWLVVVVTRKFSGRLRCAHRTRMLLALFLVQLALGAATWVTNYGWPVWFTDNVWRIRYTPVAEGRLQALVTTMHVAVGSLTLAVAVSVVLWARRTESSLDRQAPFDEE